MKAEKIGNYPLTARKVYNPLKVLIRRIKKLKIQLLSTVSLAVLILAFNILVANDNNDIQQVWVAIGLFAVAIGGWYWSVHLAGKNDEDRKIQSKIFEALATKMGVDVGNIKAKIK